MWIKSQNKCALINCNSIYYSSLNTMTHKKDGHYIKGDINDKSICASMFLGEYSTKEKALMVLDEIENHIVMMEDNYVYQMPKYEEMSDDKYDF